MKSVLVIGGNGFLGRNIVRHLVKKEYMVGVYDICRSENLESRVSYHEGNIKDDLDLENIFYNYDTIIYLISSIMPEQSMVLPTSSYMEDIPLLIKVLEICKRVGIKRVIYASSGGTVYGESEYDNCENDFLNPICHYAICKLTCERILCLYNELYSMNNVVLRVSNPYGEGQKVSSGVGVITLFMENIIANKAILVYGDGNAVRDYIHVNDVARAFEMAIDYDNNSDDAPIFNVGTGVGHSILDIIRIIANELEKEPQIIFLSPRVFDVNRSVLNVNKIYQKMGFRYQFEFEDEIIKYVRMRLKKNI